VIPASLVYAGWIALTTSVALSYRRLALSADAAGPSRPRAGAALLLLSYYLPAVA
jgi:hypothetical protein